MKSGRKGTLRTEEALARRKMRRRDIRSGRFDRAAARRFLRELEAQVAGEIRAVRASLPRAVTAVSANELTDQTHLGTVISHWYDDRHYIDSGGQPRPLRLRARGRSLAALIRRIYPPRSVHVVAQALVKSGAVRRRGAWFECRSRHMVFPAGAHSYLSGLVPVLGLLKTCRGNLRAISGRKLLQRAVTQSHVPVRELPALYRAIDRRVQPLLEVIDADMMRRVLRARAHEALAQVGLSIEVFHFPHRARRIPGSVRPPRRSARGKP